MWKVWLNARKNIYLQGLNTAIGESKQFPDALFNFD